MSKDPLVNRITHQRGPKVPSTFKDAVEGNDLAMEEIAEAWGSELQTVINSLNQIVFECEPVQDQELALDKIQEKAEFCLDVIDRHLPKKTNFSENKAQVDWNRAPTWAYWWAMDADGQAYWYAREPEIFKDNWESTDLADVAPTFGVLSDNWEESLTKRPLDQSDERIQENTPNLDLRDEQEQMLDALVSAAEVIGLYDNEFCDESEDPMHRQVSGSHYNKYPIQPAEYCYKNGLNNLQSEAISYITRYGDKGGKTDLEKAIHTLEMLIHMEYGE